VLLAAQRANRLIAQQQQAQANETTTAVFVFREGWSRLITNTHTSPCAWQGLKLPHEYRSDIITSPKF